MKPTTPEITPLKLTQFSIAGGCGCKVPNNQLSGIINNITTPTNPMILSDFRNNEDAAIVKIDDEHCMVYSLDFFTPIVDDPELFGRIAAANAISDIYAKAATPTFALAILGYPRELDGTDIAGKIIKGASDLCHELNINILGGHTIYNPQVFFGMSITGTAKISQLKLNDKAQAGDLIYHTKPIGTGIMATALKKGVLFPEDEEILVSYLKQPNNFGAKLSGFDFVHSMTDITGFGLIGHLGEICQASNVSARIDLQKVKLLPNLDEYIEMGLLTAGGKTNNQNYCQHLNGLSENTKAIVSDPQTNGGLMIMVAKENRKAFEAIMTANGLQDFTTPIGEITKKGQVLVEVIE
ncbi:MAG TPA: selenide, water dikinase SelD [Bacteroidales bacterium]|nr:selenide, water dikinase SelD [Bacteroidales bacterium]